ncbi:14646_t:CDS:2 [Racocetra fulgida]|uniref:14646_t:CDS:1 n=1 Tax=Racocetra fulgida TaxID=60492 RepID=A0A9N9A1K4_9GLOM|nr:14646_t:CDS:2 [Racocetra fulgida]
MNTETQITVNKASEVNEILPSFENSEVGNTFSSSESSDYVFNKEFSGSAGGFWFPGSGPRLSNYVFEELPDFMSSRSMNVVVGSVHLGLSSFEDPGLKDVVNNFAHLELSGSDFRLNNSLANSVHSGLPSLDSGPNDTLTNSINLELSDMNSESFEELLLRTVDNHENKTIHHSSTKLILKVGDCFTDWDAVQCAVDIYSKQHGFIAVKFHKDLDAVDKSIIRHRDYVCWKAGMNKAKKWRTITSLKNKHDHLCDPETIELSPKHSQFPQSMLDKIRDYIIVGRLSAGQQYDLLTKEFPDQYIKEKNLYNAIGKFRGVRIHDQSDAAAMLSYLLSREIKTSKLRGDMVNNFINKFYHLRNSHTQEEFESWAKYATSKMFTAGVESTQRVESINSVLKKHLDQSILLKELVKTLEQELEKESHYTCIRNYYGSNPSTGLPSTYKTIFKDIDSVLMNHLAPTPLSLQRAQMNQALLYQGALITNEQIKEYDIEADSTIEHLYDVPQIRLQELLLGVPNNEVQETWEEYRAVTNTGF